MKRELKVGDWVVPKSAYEGKKPKGSGLVILTENLKNGFLWVTVLFPEWNEGHSNNIEHAPQKYRGYVNSCWNYSGTGVERLELAQLTLKNVLEKL